MRPDEERELEDDLERSRRLYREACRGVVFLLILNGLIQLLLILTRDVGRPASPPPPAIELPAEGGR